MVKMTEGDKSVNEREIAEARELLGCNHAGGLRGLFYQRNGLPRQVLYTKSKLFEKLGILKFDPNSLETEGLSKLLGVALAKLRKQAKDAGLAWVDVEYSTPGGSRIAHHGFSNDIDIIIANAGKYEHIAGGRETIAKETRKIANKYKKLLAA
jgi:hypothetical protein